MDPDFIGPRDLVSHADPAFVFGLFGVVALLAIVYAVRTGLRQRDWLPVTACIGAALCVSNEPIYDLLGKIVYADDQFIAFHALGRSIPWFLVVGYIPWVGVLPYIISRMLAAGTHRTALYSISIAGVLSVVVVEIANAWLGAWEYYGPSPLKYFGGVAAMAAVPLVGGVLMHVVAGRWNGWRRAVAGLVIPMLALPMVFAATGWPLYLALYSDPGTWWSVAAIGAMTVLIVATVVGAVSLAMQWQEYENRSVRTPPTDVHGSPPIRNILLH